MRTINYIAGKPAALQRLHDAVLGPTTSDSRGRWLAAKDRGRTHPDCGAVSVSGTPRLPLGLVDHQAVRCQFDEGRRHQALLDQSQLRKKPDFQFVVPDVAGRH